MLAENQFGTGYAPERDELTRLTNHIYKGIGDDFDWDNGYDIESALQEKIKNRSFKLPINNQLQTSSCGGHAFSKMAAILKVMYDQTNVHYVEFSARDIYSHMHLPGGGMWAWDGALYIKNTGVVPEDVLPSKPMVEEIMVDTGLDGNSAKQFRQLIKNGSIQLVNNKDIESVSKAIRDNYIVVIAVLGKNNGTWHSDFPIPPLNRMDADWGHLIIAGKALKEKNKKYIVIANSWGEGVGRNGWQLLGKNYFESGMVTFVCTWNPVIENISRGSDFILIKDYLDKNNIHSYRDRNKIWDEIQDMFNTDITLGNYFDYMQMITRD